MRKSKKNNDGYRNCRLCAKYCAPTQVLDLKIEKVIGDEVMSILSSINITYVDFTSESNLGNVICSVCHKFLIKIQKFLHKVQKTQMELAPIGSFSSFGNTHNFTPLELNSTLPEPDSNNITDKIKSVPVREGTAEDSGQMTEDFLCKIESNSDAYDDNVPLGDLKLFEEKSCCKIEMEEATRSKIDTETHDLDKSEISNFNTYSGSESHGRETAYSFDIKPDMKSTNCLVGKNNKLSKRASSKKDKRKNSESKERKIDKIKNSESKAEHPWTCSMCDTEIDCKQQLYEHMFIEHKIFDRKRRPNNAPITEEYLTCKMCVPSIVFKTTALLTTHHWKHHNPKGMKRHICHHCGKAYTRDSLTYHLKTHAAVKPYVCQVCSMSFVDNVHLVMHSRVHTTLKPHKCPECEKRFTRKQLLRNHLLIHSGEKPFACHRCDKRFRNVTNLKAHENIHTGVYPFECKHCDKRFSCWGNCNRHMWKVHHTTLARTKATPQGKFPVDPNTGEIIKPPDLNLEEWQRKLMSMSTKYKKTLASY